ncbi:tetraacyldisaccharide 4'-kinase [Pontibacter qinzhouensis]|uniref:Tetraacyldisaccharide 4'-kinase n=1 Tax=Pontibacter qinzhouensis TaxID=2603253 RepID=A0A5C8KAB1_9BACT|nr:tetraacyldisaccharide 4'-kinase [Pontibacter qinzhouensis]TXK45792.1 tetraacyldisaccharide 4'-kinase [Pontibacter qinzhouensis]
MVKKLKLLLLPFSILYGGVMRVRNYLYDAEVLPVERFAMPVLAVGNLTVGGTGKTPHVEYLLRLLALYRVATLSRGYKRSTKGFVLAGAEATATSIGDEPFQYYQDFKGTRVAVSENRVAGIHHLQQLKPAPDIIVLDDAMQHRPVQPSLNLLITDFLRPFYKDFVLPAGLLREPRAGARRADAVLVSKCPASLTGQERQKIRSRIRKYTKPHTPIFFTGYRYGKAVRFGSKAATLGKEVILLTGIANAAPLVEYLQEQGYSVLQHLAYPDHYHYTIKDLQEVQELLQAKQNSQACIITTRKDAVKLEAPEITPVTQLLPLFYIPIEVFFLEDQATFDSLVLEHVAERIDAAKQP